MPEQQSLRMADGRILEFIEFGHPAGYPVFYFHGIPASGSEVLLVQEELIKSGLHIIAPDRPGVGNSDFLVGRSFSDWPKDVTSLADHLGIDRFAVLGNSGGAAYVLACAIQFPERLTNAVIVSGAWQMNQPEAVKYLYKMNRLFWAVASDFTFLLPPVLRGMRISEKINEDQLLAKFRKMMHPVDFDIIRQGDRPQTALQTMNAGLRQLRGAAHEFRLYAKSNGLDLGKIGKPIAFFHGELDKNVPIQLVRKMLDQMPEHRLTVYPDDTHLSTFCRHIGDIISAIMALT